MNQMAGGTTQVEFRTEIDNIFNRIENIMRLSNDNTTAILGLLPEEKRLEYLLTSQNNAIAFFENLADKAFDLGSKAIEKMQ
jgi:hypothetical protein